MTGSYELGPDLAATSDCSACGLDGGWFAVIEAFYLNFEGKPVPFIKGRCLTCQVISIVPADVYDRDPMPPVGYHYLSLEPCGSGREPKSAVYRDLLTGLLEANEVMLSGCKEEDRLALLKKWSPWAFEDHC